MLKDFEDDILISGDNIQYRDVLNLGGGKKKITKSLHEGSLRTTKNDVGYQK